MNLINQNIKRLFEASGMNQREYAELFGVSQKVIWTYVNKGTRPGGAFIVRLCNHYSIDLNFLSNTKIKVNAQGEIVNRPDYRTKAKKIRAEIDALMTEKQAFDNSFAKRLYKLAVELESVAFLRR